MQVILEVQQFSPEEITVKTTGNNVIVEARHEERQDEHGFVSRHFVRRYVLPPSHDVINVTSSLSSDGVLTITAPKKVKLRKGSPANPKIRALTSLFLAAQCVCVREIFFLPLFCALFRFPKVPGAPLAVVENSFREDGARWVSSISIKLRVCSKLMHASRGALLELFERRRGNFEL